MVTIDASVWVAAFDQSDVFHAHSAAFLQVLTTRRTPLYDPRFVLVEVGCALARRYQSALIGEQAAAHISNHPLI